MAGGANAVFLSYASDDSEAAQRIADSLKATGIEVWFDKSELRGGDAWDRTIRQQIHDCRLFVPVISARSEARPEGYFRREWKLAVERTHDMSERLTFIVPVVVDGTLESSADVPDAFRTVQWTRLPAGETPTTFVELVQRLLSPVAASTPVRAQADGHASPNPASIPVGLARRRTVLLYGGIAAAALMAIVYFALERSGGSNPVGADAASIAVLPLANESGDPGQQYFSDGISEDLITALAQFPGLKVIGRTSSFQFRDSKEDSRSIGAKLQVAHVLEGSVRRSGDVVRVSAQLINAADGTTQWSERYDRPYRDLFALQDEITRAVAGALRARLLTGEHAAAQSERPPGGNLNAYNAELQGRFYQFRETEPDLRKAIEYYTQATQLDPSYALAWSDLARVSAGRAAEFLEGAPAQEAFANAREWARRAVDLAPDLATAHVARGYVLENADFDWHAAESEFRRALALAPNDAEAKFYFGRQLASFGELQQAIEFTRQALAIEPLRANWHNWLATYLSGVDRLDEAELANRRALDLQPGAAALHFTLTLIEVQRGRSQAALAAAQQEPPGPWQDSAFAFARQIGSDRAAADTALRNLIDKDSDGSAYQIADVYALRNDAEASFNWLDRAWSNRDTGIEILLFDPFIRRYKDDPRFAAFCRKVGLPVPREVRQKT